MAFFTDAVGVLQTLTTALGAGLGIWGIINLMEGYGNDNRATRCVLFVFLVVALPFICFFTLSNRKSTKKENSMGKRKGKITALFSKQSKETQKAA